MYRVTLHNLSPDARTVATGAWHEKRDVPDDALQVLLRDFCEIDPIENAVADTEIRVQVRSESFLLRTENRKLILYDAHRRDLPGQILTAAQAMKELDGTASAARHQAILQARGTAESAEAGPVVPLPPPPPRPGKTRVIVLSAAAAGLLVVMLRLVAPGAGEGSPPGFVPAGPAESRPLLASLAGVYLTGDEPGQHGIVLDGPEELKLFELGTVNAPRVVHADYRPGRLGRRWALLTDQPGGLVEITAEGNLVYCGETYRRIR